MSCSARIAAALLALPLALAAPAPAGAGERPETIPLPAGSQPEGVTSGPGTTFYAGSRADGRITVGDLRTGTSRTLVAGVPGRIAVGLRHDARTGTLWVAGGTTGAVTQYDARTGQELGRWTVPGDRFLNDVEVTPDAVYVTDSRSNELVVVRDRVVSLLPVTGDLVLGPGNNANGVRALPGGDLLLTQSNTGDLLRVDPATGVADRLETTGPDLTAGDGLVLRGSTLYVVYGFSRDSVAVVDLGPGARTATVVGELTDPDLDRPTTGILVGGDLWLVNGRFSTPPTPTTAYDLVRL